MFDKKELNIEEIKSLIPHRYPFLLIDRLIEIKPFESATGIKNVTINENYFQGHFENKAVMPGALIIESMAQSAGTLVLYSLKKTYENISVYLLSVDKAKFRKPVCPGDVLRMEVKKKIMSGIFGNLFARVLWIITWLLKLKLLPFCLI